MPVNPSQVIFSDSPADLADLWEITSSFRADWKDGVKVRTAFITQIDAARTEAEQRRGFLGRPYRTVEAMIRAYDSDKVRSFYDNAMRQALAKSMVPLYSDQAYLTAASQGTIFCDTRDRRFFTGARVMVQNTAGEVGYSEIESIVVGQNGQIVLDDPLYQSFSKGSIVYPLIEARPNFSSEMNVLTSNILEMMLSATELPSSASLDVLASPGSLPLGFSTYEGLPIFDILSNYRESIGLTIKRNGNFAAAGITQSPSAYGASGRGNLSYSALFESRELAFRLIRFFESRGGSLHPFWVPSPVSAYEPITKVDESLTVAAIGPESNWNWRKTICQIHPLGVAVRRVLSVFRSGSTDVLTLDSPMPFPLSGSKIVDAYKSRFSKDELVEEWATDEVCVSKIETTEVLEEQSITVPDITEPTPTPISARFSPTSEQAESSVADVKMYFRPCEAKGNRPLVRAADLAIPAKITVTVRAGKVIIDEDFVETSGAVSAAMLAAVQDVFECEYVSSSTVPSRHWHQTRYAADGSGATHEGEDVEVTRYLYQTTKNYTGADSATHTLKVIVAVLDPATALGCRSALIHGYIFSTEVNEDYVEDATYAPLFNATFTEADPAVYGGLVGRSTPSEMRLLHPRCVLHFYVPTTFESPCGNKPWGCDDEEIAVHGFSEACKAVTSAIPWLAESSGSTFDNALENFVYTDDLTEAYSGVMLGGDCPISSLVPFVVVENGGDLTGLTALRPVDDGLVNDRLSVLEGSAVTIAFCEADQSLNAISCCDGHPDEPLGGIGGTPKCWRAHTTAPRACNDLAVDAPEEETGKRCCFSATSAASVQMTQKCMARLFTLDEFPGCAEINDCSSDPQNYPWSIFNTRVINFSLSVCSMDFALADSTQRKLTWRAWFPDSIQAKYTWDEDFDSVDPLTWTTYGGSWGSFEAGQASSGTASGSDNINAKAMLSGTGSIPGQHQHVNMSVSAEVNPTEVAGVIARGSTSTGASEGYAALVSRTDKWFRLYWLKQDTNERVLLAELADLDLPTGPIRVSCSVEGDRIVGSIELSDKELIEAQHCGTKAAGIGGLAVVSGSATFDNFSLAGSPTMSPITAAYSADDDGFSLVIPKDIVGEGIASCVSDSNDCPEVCGCSYTQRTMLPESINASQASELVSGPGQAKPYEGNGGTCAITNPPGTCPGFGEYHTPTPDWVHASLRISSDCIPSCPDGASSSCTGMDVWGGWCLPPTSGA